jgi:GAF domain-containing protein
MLCLTFFGHDWVHPVATEELAAVVDREQLGTGEGPCPESIRLRRTVRAELTEISVFWPAFARLCRETGIRGFVVAPVLRGGSTLGTLSCYSRKPRSLGSSDERAVGFVAATISAMRGLVSQRV